MFEFIFMRFTIYDIETFTFDGPYTIYTCILSERNYLASFYMPRVITLGLFLREGSLLWTLKLLLMMGYTPLKPTSQVGGSFGFLFQTRDYRVILFAR